MGMFAFNEDKKTGQESFYVIVLTMRGERPGNGKGPGIKGYTKASIEYFDFNVFFKSDRYSCYTGRLQVDHYISEANQYKTAAGARKAIDRLLGSGTIKDRHKPIVCRYATWKTERFDTVEEDR